MKLCACCSAPADNKAPTCANCGEASWLDAGSEPPPAPSVVIGVDLGAGDGAASAPETQKKKRGR